MGLQPKYDSNPAAFIFFLVYITTSSFFFLNLLVGVIFDNFCRRDNKHNKVDMLTTQQRTWVRAQEAVFEQARPLVNAAMEGANATIFAYGQTGSGKVRPQRMHRLRR